MKIKTAIFLALLWLFGIGYGMSILMTHERTPSSQSNPFPPSGELLLSFLHDKPFGLVMFAHPHCICTKASISELQWILSKCSDSVQATILFVKPEGASEDWEKSDSWQLACELPNVHVVVDESAMLAKRLGALTSGQTFLINSTGNILFSGGITNGRGVTGDNAGRRAILSLAKTSPSNEPPQSTANVFGCTLY
ncbi:MAG: RedB protein [Chloroherpetonaceae bacterium]